MTKVNKGNGGRERRVFSAEFKMEAVRLMRERQKLGVSLAQVGRELDVRPDMLRRWAEQVEERAGRPPRDVFPGSMAAGGRGGAAAVAAEVAVLRQERDFLKHAAAFFAKESR